MNGARHAHHGMVLILVLIVIAALSLAALTYAEWMLTEREAAFLSERQAQARALAASGVAAAQLFLSNDAQTRSDSGGSYDNPGLFCGVVVLDADAARDRGRFTVVAPIVDDAGSGGVRYGLEDESAKINLNAILSLVKEEDAAREVLMSLPGMTEDVADAILDWIDSDDETRTFGAEVDYYSTLDPPYAPKNGPLGTIEELLMVRGVTPALLLGVDANRNGYADDTEADPSLVAAGDALLGSMDRGWAGYLTLHSAGAESNLTAAGEAKINVNQDSLETLHEELAAVFGEEWATFIVAYRQQQKAYEQGSQEPEKLETKPSGELDLSKEGKLKLKSVLDLIGQRVQVQYKGAEEPVVLESLFPNDPAAMAEYLPELVDGLTTGDDINTTGRINVNQAPAAVLAAIPGLPDEAVDRILSARQGQATSDTPPDPTWLLIDGILTLDEMKAIMPYVTGGGSIFRAQVVGFYDAEGPAARVEVVIDAGQQPPAIVSWRDLSNLGRGYPLDVLGAETFVD